MFEDVQVLRRAGFSLGLAALISCSGCHGLGRGVPEDRLVRSAEYLLIEGLDVPVINDPEGCGAQALATVISAFDPARDAREVYRRLPIRDRLTTPIDLLVTARGHGYDARVSKGGWAALNDSLRQGIPPLVMLGKPPSGLPASVEAARQLYHWCIVSGMSHDQRKVLLAVPGQRHRVLGRGRFMRRWSVPSCCMITVRPSSESEDAE